MSFRVYCAWCANQLSPPFWGQYGQPFCNPNHAALFKDQADKKSDVSEVRPDNIQDLRTMTEIAEAQAKTIAQLRADLSTCIEALAKIVEYGVGSGVYNVANQALAKVK